VLLQYVDERGYSVDKIFSFRRGSYEIGLTQTLRNTGPTALAASPYVRYVRTAYALGGEPRFTPTFLGVGLYEQRDPQSYRFRKESFEDLDDEAVELKQTGGWLAMLQHYFVAAIIPPPQEEASFSARPSRERGYLAQYVGATQAVASGGEQRFDSRLYIGPKLQSRIGELAPGFELTLDYGILTALAKPLFWVLEQFHKLTGNWGWAIVLLTVVVRSVMYKLSEAQYRSMAKMKVFAPKIQDIKERYADDRERLQKAMMDLYKKEGFNPLAGCWPLLVQMPVFFALYWVLLESVELRQAPFALWIQDLSATDPYYVLPVLYGLTIYIQQKLSGQQMIDPMQQKIMNVMPIALTAFFVFFQSGLVLYWLVSNTIGIAQQWYITRKLEREGFKRG
jgi:YidC/Oxa1 family membrane protein insertase